LRWYARNNARLRETTDARRLCWLDGCDLELNPAQRKFCSAGHADLDRKRRQRQRLSAVAEAPQASLDYFEMLLREDGAQRNRSVRRAARRPILRRGDTERVYDRVRAGEGRVLNEAHHERDLSPTWNGVALSPADREALRDVVCGICQRFAVDCAMLMQHQAITMRVVILAADSTHLEVAA
jgi:hypothetical protein